MAGIIGIVKFENLKKLIERAKADPSFREEDAEVFINCNDDLAITWCNEHGYCGYFLNFKTGEVIYGD